MTVSCCALPHMKPPESCPSNGGQCGLRAGLLSAETPFLEALGTFFPMQL